VPAHISLAEQYGILMITIPKNVICVPYFEFRQVFWENFERYCLLA